MNGRLPGRRRRPNATPSATVERAKAKEREGVGAAAEDAVDAVEEHQTSVRQAARAKAEADRIRRQADSLTTEADLP